tara:strand:- start:2515 stop:2775 length:261 start_codon:yes stop_codon:yes gene_type:complete
MTIAALEAQMTRKELESWMIYYSEQPFGSWRDNYHSAMLCSILWNVNAGKGKGKSPDDFMFKTQTQKRQSTTQQTLGALQALAQRK